MSAFFNRVKLSSYSWGLLRIQLCYKPPLTKWRLLCKFYRCWAIIHPLTWATESLHYQQRLLCCLHHEFLFSSEDTATEDVFAEWSCYHASAICSVASHHLSSHLSRRNWLS